MAEKKLDVLDASGKTVKKVSLPDAIFGREPNVPLMHQVVVAQLAAARSGTAKTKTRGEVRGGGKKPWRQKGTGRARQGSIRAPQWRGGGVVHGPVPRSYAQDTPKKMKAAALYSALSDRVRGDRMHVVTEFIAAERPSTKVGREALERIAEQRRTLVVVSREDSDTQVLSLRNLPQVHILYVDQLNTYDVLVNDDLIFTLAALTEFSPESKVTAARSTAKKKEPKAAEAKAEKVEKADVKKTDEGDEK